MMTLKRKMVLGILGLFTLLVVGCNSDETITPLTDETLEDNSVIEEISAPTKEEVLKMRAIALEGMSEEEIARLTENIKVANMQMEEAYMYDDLFGKLEDENHLYWNYFDKVGDIQIGWTYDGTYQTVREIREKEDLTLDEFYVKYGTPVMAYNRFDANNFIELMDDMKSSIHNETFKNDMQYIIDETRLAQETHDAEHANNIYKALHDMDYFLLRYGIEDVGQYTKDASVVAKYYGVLSIYAE